jgi:hypothetical protein
MAFAAIVTRSDSHFGPSAPPTPTPLRRLRRAGHIRPRALPKLLHAGLSAPSPDKASRLCSLRRLRRDALYCSPSCRQKAHRSVRRSFLAWPPMWAGGVRYSRPSRRKQPLRLAPKSKLTPSSISAGGKSILSSGERPIAVAPMRYSQLLMAGAGSAKCSLAGVGRPQPWPISKPSAPLWAPSDGKSRPRPPLSATSLSRSAPRQKARGQFDGFSRS